jgi:hypothetical protein
MSYVLNFVATLPRPETEAGEGKKYLQPSLFGQKIGRPKHVCTTFSSFWQKIYERKKLTEPDFSDTIFELAIISTNLFRAEER